MRLSTSVAALRMFGDTLIPEEITSRVGTTPTNSYRKGDVERMRNGRELVRKTGMWLLEAEKREPEDLNSQVTEILSRLTPDLEIWRELSRDYQLDLFCGLFMEESNERLCLSTLTLASLAERGIEIVIEVYAPSESGDTILDSGLE